MVKLVDSGLAPFISSKDELTPQQHCDKWGIRVVIPPKLRPRVLAVDDLFVSRDNAQGPLYFPIGRDHTLLGIDAMVHQPMHVSRAVSGSEHGEGTGTINKGSIFISLGTLFSRDIHINCRLEMICNGSL
ncbi:hypothetical protein F2P81_011837 [Scophthalmus maximus]|uniref:Uncharacterized protein n=1 Tax=Scophthalmus maximus TaxID=52904 RepID=A0A6A4SV09_SCOMX|nr:hypothetical protein F2P81_011837 [Scophthalmus maximus]